jgi:hypothetical protein
MQAIKNRRSKELPCVTPMIGLFWHLKFDTFSRIFWVAPTSSPMNSMTCSVFDAKSKKRL